jgi:hypothetical protein
MRAIDHPYRSNALNLLLSYRIELEARENLEAEEKELMMQLSPLLLELFGAEGRSLHCYDDLG